MYGGMFVMCPLHYENVTKIVDVPAHNEKNNRNLVNINECI